MPSSPGIGMHVEVRDPDDKTVMSKVFSSEGRFTFTSHIPGEHVICLYSNSTKWFAGSQLVRPIDYMHVYMSVVYLIPPRLFPRRYNKK